MNFASPITAPTSPAPDAARHYDARTTRARAPLIEAEPLHGERLPGSASRAYRAVDEAGGREQRLPARIARPRRPQDEETTSPGFAAQHIAQEVLSEGLHFENFRPALAAYSAVATEFAQVGRPPAASIVIWA